MKKLFFTFLLGILTLNLMAQQDPKFSQNMFLTPLFNPGAAGSSDKICATAVFRNQWTGLPDAPVVTAFAAHMPVQIFGRTHGIGLNLKNDNIAFNNDFYLNGSYAYRIDLGSGKLGLGLNIGLANYSISPSWNDADIMDIDGDVAIPKNEGSYFALDMGLGAFYNTDKMFAGLSVTHLNQAKFNIVEETAEPSLVRHYYATAGYIIQLTNPIFEIIPTFLVQTDTRSNHIYLNTNLRYNKRFWGGVSYTVGGAMTVLAGIEMLNGVMIGYSYDFELSPLIKYNSGSHEVTVRYCFDLSVDKSPQKYKSIRFL
jgi:type IX secretion system PorP/SprF family membrane protein